MQIERADHGWIVRVPDHVAAALGLHDGTRVTLRPISEERDEVRYGIAHLRARLPDYPFDRESWNGIDVEPSAPISSVPIFAWSTKPAPTGTP